MKKSKKFFFLYLACIVGFFAFIVFERNFHHIITATVEFYEPQHKNYLLQYKPLDVYCYETFSAQHVIKIKENRLKHIQQDEKVKRVVIEIVEKGK